MYRIFNWKNWRIHIFIVQGWANERIERNSRRVIRAAVAQGQSQHLVIGRSLVRVPWSTY